MALKLTTAPTDLAVPLAEAKLHLRVDANDEDALITSMIHAATAAAEQQTGRALMPQQWTLSLDEFPDVVHLTRIPVTSVVSIKYDDQSGVEQTLSTDVYALRASDDFSSAEVRLRYGQSWPSTRDQADCVRIIFAAGYANAAAVPDGIKAWIKLVIGAMFTNRESEVVKSGSAISLGFADSLLDRYKVYA